jgi:hypothetical protein
MIEGYNLELLPFGRDQYISSLPPRLNLRVQKIKEQSDQIHLPIMHGSDKKKYSTEGAHDLPPKPLSSGQH